MCQSNGSFISPRAPFHDFHCQCRYCQGNKHDSMIALMISVLEVRTADTGKFYHQILDLNCGFPFSLSSVKFMAEGAVL